MESLFEIVHRYSLSCKGEMKMSEFQEGKYLFVETGISTYLMGRVLCKKKPSKNGELHH